MRPCSTTPGWKIQLYYSSDGTNWSVAPGTTFTISFTNDANSNGFDPAPGSITTVTGTLDAFIPKGAPFFLEWNYTTGSATSVDATSAQALGIDDVSILGVVSQ